MRKKFTMLFAALLACVGVAKAQFVETSTAEAPKYYVIASYNRGGFLTNAGVGNGLTHVDLTDAGYWYFEKANEDGGVYIVNKTLSEGNKVYVGSDCKASTTAAVWYVKENGVNKKGLSISKTATISNYSCIDANNNNTGVGTWQPSTDDWQGTTWVLASITDPTYNPNNLIFRTRSDRYVTSVALNGGFNNSAEVNRDYQGNNGLVYNDLTETVTMRAVAGETVTASLTRNGAWTNAYVYIDYDNDGFTANIAEDGFTPAEDLVSYSFYSGDEADDTSGKNSAGTELTTSARNTLTLPAFTAPSTPGTYRLRFKHDWNSINPNGGNANFNSNGGSFIDVTLEVISSTIEVQYSYQYNGVEKYTQTSKALVGDEWPAITVSFPYGVLSAAKPEGVIADADVTDGVAAKVVELAIEKELPFEAAAAANSITTWYYVKMHTNQPGYLGDIADDKTINVANGKSSDVYSDNYVWGFVGNVFDGITVVNKGTGLQLTSTGSGNATLTAEGTPFFVARTSETSANATNGFCLRKSDSNQYLNANYGAAKLSHWGSTDAGSTFFLAEYEEAEVSVSDVDWATMYLGYTTYIPEGVNVYAVASVEDGYVTLNQLEGVIPANTGVLLENAGKFTFKKAAKDPAAVESKLIGTATDVATSTVENENGVVYTLQSHEDGVAFKKFTGETILANKAYLVLPAETKALRIRFAGEETGIDQFFGDEELVIYDLAGRRVEKMEKGIYIVNGKKVVIK